MTAALVGALLCLTQPTDVRAFRVLACFFLALVLTEFGDALAPIVQNVSAQIALNAIWIVGAAAAMPLLWVYIWMLTGQGQTFPPRLWLHAISPGIAALFFASIYLLTPQDRQILLTDMDGAISTQAAILSVGYELFAYAVITIQWLVYLVLVSHRLTAYRSRLRDVFASTEGKELRWVAGLVGVVGGYWALGVILLALDLGGVVTDVSDAPDHVLNLILVGILVVWGLRQRPAFHRAEVAVQPTAQSPKYAKSALTDAMAVRIASKLQRAMEIDQMHLDPNLSLYALSSHVGVSDNYVSQVLNEEIGQNFFDFVNSYRVSEAQKRLRAGNETILTIAYDTGFNSRSSFYTAFQKVTGQTPTAFRKGPV